MHYRALSYGHACPIILGRGYSFVHYNIHRKNGDKYPAPLLKEWGSLPLDLGEVDVEIVFVYDAAMKEDDLEITGFFEPRFQIRLVILDKNGRDDWATTRELYNKIFEIMKPPELSDDDDGWDTARPPWHVV